ncbi:MAG: CHASE2 domain-containing protein, partial [Pseudomonadota bacterium]
MPQLRDLAAGIGSITVSAMGQTNIVRTVPLLWRSDNGLLPGLSLEALRVALGETTFIVGGSQELEGVVDYIRFGGLTVPTTEHGQFWVYYRPYDQTDYVSVKDILAGNDETALRNALEGHIVLVGTSAPGLLDIRATPLGVNVPGVSIHAQIIEQILLGEFLHRSDLIGGLEILAFLLLGGVVTLVMARYRAVISIAAGGLAAVFLVGGSFYAFVSSGVLFDATFPIIGGAINFGALAAYQFIVVDREKRFMRTMFSHHVSPSVLQEMEQNDYSLELGGETREITILFVDVRDFTALSENFESTELVSLLNQLFTTLGAA